jgi:DNA-binding ferritin-like protein (Dps family)
MNSSSPMIKPGSDPLLEEIRAIKESISASVGHDVAELCRQLQQDQEKSGHPIVRLKLTTDRPGS